jgi:predicted ferric reductase
MKKFLFIAFFLNLFIIMLFWWQGSASLFDGKISNIIFAFGKLSGLLAVYAILLQFVLRGRAVWIEEVFGLNNLSTVHRLNGYLVLVFLLLHFTFILTSYSIFTKTDVVSQLITFITSETDFLYAFFALILFITVVFLSIYIVRKRLKYEIWYYTHLFTYLAILLAWGHQLKFGGDFIGNTLFTGYWYAIYIFVFANFFVFRYLRQGFLFYKYKFNVAKVVPETEDTTSVYISGNNLSRFSLQPGQFFILRFLDSKRWWQAHPFSLSFVPKDNQLRVTVKNVGDFTSEIPQLKPGTPLLLDGPLGTFTQKSLR